MIHRIALALIFLLAAFNTNAADIKEFEVAEGEARKKILREWLTELDSQRIKGMTDAQKASWEPRLLAMAKAVATDHSIADPVFGIFTRIKSKTPSAKVFALNILNAKSEACQRRHMGVIYLGKDIGAFEDDKVIKAAVEAAVLDGSSYFFSALFDVAKITPGMHEKLIAHIQSGPPHLQLMGLRYTMKGTPTEEQARKSYKLAASIIADPKVEDEALHAAGRFVLESTPKPDLLIGSLTDEETETLVQVIKAGDYKKANMALVTLLMGTKQWPDSLDAAALVKTFSAAPEGKDKLLAVIGFLEPGELTAEQQAGTLQWLKGRSYEASSGLFSYYWRGGGDIRLATDRNLKFGEATWMPTGEYLKALHNADSYFCKTAAHIKTTWDKGEKPSRVSAVQMIPLFPKSDEAKYVIAQGISMNPPDQKVQEKILEALWRARLDGRAWTAIPGLQDWLVKWTTDKNEERKVKAAGILFHAFGDKRTATDLIEAMSKANSRYLQVFSYAVEVLIEVSPNHSLLRKLRENFEDTKGLAARRGLGEWYLWVLDLRLGRKVGKPPIASLAKELQLMGTSIFALLGAGESAYPHLADLRDPRLLVLSSSRNMWHVMSLLGTLDRLEQQKQDKK